MSKIILDLDSEVPHNEFDPLFVSSYGTALGVPPRNCFIHVSDFCPWVSLKQNSEAEALNQNKELKEAMKARRTGGKLQSQRIIQCRYVTYTTI